MATFSDFKKDFYSRLENVDIFNCGEINLIKVVLDGLKVKYDSRGNYRAYVFYPSFFYRLFRFSKTKFSKTKFNISKFEQRIKVFSNVKYCVSDIGRVVLGANKSVKSLYFDNIVNLLGRENTIIVIDQKKKEAPDYDFDFFELKTNAHLLPENIDSRLLRKNLINTYKTIKRSGKFKKDELRNIQIAFHNFFIEYKAWSFLISKLTNIIKCYFICHYHKEGQILALKSKGVECIELQHGLIAEQDIFYVFPPIIKGIRHRCLFADKIFVYGEYWKKILLKGYEYLDSQIEIIGFYLYDDFRGNIIEKEKIEKLILNRVAILITTQTFLHEYFIEFALALEKRLKKENKKVLLLVKPHPAENEKIYQEAFSNLPDIEVVNYPLSLLFDKVKIHISVYSTTLYDGIRFGVSNFVFKVKGCEDYVDEIIKSGIAIELTEDCDLLETAEGKINLNRIFFFLDFKYELIN